jgi:mono/diheme cytochrome c family protein
VPFVKLRLSVAAVLVAFVAGCGGSSGDSKDSNAPATTTAGGAKLFTDNCSTCHTLKAAGASGKIGPDLDMLKPGPALVTSQVNTGGGAMPSFKGKLTDAQIKQIADYVSGAAGKS